MAISTRDIDHVFERLRSGVVPERGLEAFAVGIDTQRTEIARQLTLAESREGVFKFLRGGYGCGKTFMCRLAAHEAQLRNFATSFVVVSDNDLRFHQFDDVYRKVIQELSTRPVGDEPLFHLGDPAVEDVGEGSPRAGAG
ncbi:MAG: BREX system ATP-binding domain-containing protein, partial [Acidobacteriota bacterium]